MPGAFPLGNPTPHHHVAGPHITTIWHACQNSLYPSPTSTAVAFYAMLVLIAVLVIALWAHARRTDE